MRKYIVLTLLGWLGLSLFDGGAITQNLTRSDDSLIKKSDSRIEQQSSYRDFSAAVFEVDDGNVNVEARLTTMDRPLKDVPAGLPLTRFTIKNLGTGKIIHEEVADDRPLSMYTNDLNDDGFAELILIWNKGAVARRLQIISVDGTKADVVLDESYRFDATLMRLGEKTVDAFITTGDSGGGPFETKRYIWRGKKYALAGRTPHARFARIIKQEFSKKAQ